MILKGVKAFKNNSNKKLDRMKKISTFAVPTKKGNAARRMPESE
jgi:hypothetical protein